MDGRKLAKYAAWLLAGAAIVAVGVNVVEAVSEQAGSSSLVMADFYAAPDGTAKINMIHPPIQPVLADVIFRVQEFRSAAGSDVWWRVDWSIDIRPAAGPLTALQRREIIDASFKGWSSFTPSEALAAIPTPGSTVVSGNEFVLHRAAFLGEVVSGWPVAFVLVAGAIGVVVRLTPKAVDQAKCAGCGYSRAGLKRGAACPECGMGSVEYRGRGG